VDEGHAARFACVVAFPNSGKWREGLGTVQAELRRFAAEGPTETEVLSAAEKIRSQLRGEAYQSAVRQTSAIADRIADAEAGGMPFVHPQEMMRVYDLLVSGLTPADVKAAFERDWTGTGPLLTLNSGAPVAKEELLAAWAENEKAEQLATYEDRGDSAWTYSKFGKRGKVVSEAVFPAEGFKRFVYKNGTILTHKPTDFQAGVVEIRVRFGHGERGLTFAQRLPASLGAALLPAGGLGQLDPQEINSALGHNGWQLP
jgi:zinc protease